MQDPINFIDPSGLVIEWDDVVDIAERAGEALRRGKEGARKTLKDIRDWGNKIVDDAAREIDKFTKSDNEENTQCPVEGMR